MCVCGGGGGGGGHMQCLILHEKCLTCTLGFRVHVHEANEKLERRKRRRRRRRRRRKRRRTSGYVNKFSSTNMMYCYHIIPE